MEAKVTKKSELENSASRIGHGVKQSSLLSGAWDGKYAVAVVVADGIKPKAEVHEKSADVWRVEKGKAKFILGGKLVHPEVVGQGEFVADKIEGGEVFGVSEGDIVDVPVGVAHQLDSLGGRVELLIIKINH